MSYYNTTPSGLVSRSQLRGAIEDAADGLTPPPPPPEADDQSWLDKLLGKAPELADTVRDIYAAVKAENPGISDQEAMEWAHHQAQEQSSSPFSRYLPWAAVAGAGLLVVLAVRKR